MRWVPDILLIDGRNTLYRATDAHKELSWVVNGKEVRTGGLYGFLSMLIAYKARFGAAIEVCWEGENNFRKVLYPEYKANRKIEKAAKPVFSLRDLVNEQEPIVQEILTLLGVKQWSCNGGECDDVLATLAVKYEQEGYNVLIVSGDSDCRQVVTEGIRVMSSGKNAQIFAVEDVQSTHGVLPQLLPDIKAIAGDTSDNIPGVPGLGNKTAVKLVNAHGSIDSVLKSVRYGTSGLSPKQVKSVQSVIDRVPLYKELTTLLRNVELVEHKPAKNLAQAEARLKFYGCFAITDQFYAVSALNEIEGI